MIEQKHLATIFSERPEKFSWFLGAGCSRMAGLPTATDIIWDLKRQLYSREENKVSIQDIQNEAIKNRIQDFMENRGFPSLWADNEYTLYFDKIFGDDRERQRKYLFGMLAEDKVKLAIGNRIIGALLSSKLTEIIFTANFDTVVEKAVAEIGGASLAPFHVEGSRAALSALNNKEFPIYCKLHGDFRYDSIKNLETDLANQNEELASCFINSASRYGMIVAGYSGRDNSIMDMFEAALKRGNAFPHGFYWTGIKGSKPNPAVSDFLLHAQARGVKASYVEIDTFDTLMLKLWRQLENAPKEIDKKIRKSVGALREIDLPDVGNSLPLIRFNAIPIVKFPEKCFSVTTETDVGWAELKQIERDSEREVLLAKDKTIYLWGDKSCVSKALNKNLVELKEIDISVGLDCFNNTILKSFITAGLARAISNGKPIIAMSLKEGTHIIADIDSDEQLDLSPLLEVTKPIGGTINGLIAPATDNNVACKVKWAEAIRISIEKLSERAFLVIEPDIWIWPRSARKLAKDFIDRKAKRKGSDIDKLISAWVEIIFSDNERNKKKDFSPYSKGTEAENPVFTLSNRTAFSKKIL